VRRPEPLLAGAEPTQIPKRETVWRQLYQAKTADSELAWQSVWRYFPEETYAIQLAKQGLVRYYLWQTGEYNKALPLLAELATQAEPEPRAFGLAGQAIVASLQGNQEQALKWFALLTPELSDRLDSRTRRMLADAMTRSRAAMTRDAQRKLEELQAVPAENELPEPPAS